MARIFDEVGLPEGVFQVVIGPGGSVGDYLATLAARRHGGLDGQRRGRQADHDAGGQDVKKVGLELGGKSPNIVFADADFEAAIDGACSAPSPTAGRSAAPARGCSSSARSTTASSASWSPGEAIARRPRPRPSLRDGPAGRRASSSTPSSATSRSASTRAPRLACGGKRLAGQGLLLRADHLRRRRQQRCASPRRRSSGRCSSSSPSTPKRRPSRIANDTDLRPRRRRLDAATCAKADARRQGGARRHHLRQHLPPEPTVEAALGRLQAERHRPRAGHVGIEEFTELKSRDLRGGL